MFCAKAKKGKDSDAGEFIQGKETSGRRPRLLRVEPAAQEHGERENQPISHIE